MAGNYIRTKEHKKKMSRIIKRVWKSGKYTKERDKKISIALKGNKNSLGHHHTLKVKKQMSLSHLGKKLNEITKKKIGLANKGRKRPDLSARNKLGKGKKLTEKHKEKIKTTLIKTLSNPKIRNQRSKQHKGILHTKESKQKMSKIRIDYLSSNRCQGKGKTFDTKIELAIEAELRRRNIPYVKQFNANDIACVDFWLPTYKTLVFCDGNYWHKYPEGTKRDKKVTKQLLKKKWKVFRFWGSEIKKDANACIVEMLTGE